MASLEKIRMNDNKNNNDSSSTIPLIIIAALILIVTYYTCQRKSENYQCQINKISRENNIHKDKYPYQDVSQNTVMEQNQDYANTLKTPQQLVQNYQQIYPDDLLPQTKETTEWQRSNPPGAGSLELANMLDAGQHIGVNTQGSSMRNANLQIRSEYPNPIIPVSIFNNSSITPDIFRKELEVGESIAA